MTNTLTYNFLPSNAFDFKIEGIPEVNFKLQTATLPSIALPSATLPWRDANQYFAGDQIDYEPLEIEFIVDEDLKNYEEIYKWIHENMWGKSEKTYRDAIFATLTASSNFNRLFTFKNAFPETLGSMQFRTEQGSDIQYITCTATFRYSEITLDGTNTI